jgi:hypothetical protein
MKKLILFSFCLILHFGVQAADVRTVATTAGQLGTDASAFLGTVTDLTITGTIDDLDFVIMRDYMPLLASLDLSEVNIVEFEGSGGTAVFGSYRNYPANQIPDYAFFEQVTNTFKTNLKVIIPPKSITSIGSVSLTGTGITTFTVPSLVTSINGSFYNCPDLIECILPASLTSIGNSTFFVCQNIKYITIPDAVTTIGSQAFESCSALPSINIPAGVTSIGTRAFLDCSALSNIKVYAVNPANILLGASVFNNVDTLTCTLQVPSGTKALYEVADQWKSFKTIVEGFVAPTTATKPTTNIGATTATGNGTITSLGDVNPTQHGVVWSTAHNPDVSLSTKTTQGVISTAGDFSSDISGLEPGTTYYVRAYATNNVGTSYGDEVAFNTLASQTISFGALDNKTYGDAAFNLSATTSAIGLTVTYVSDNEAVAMISGSTLSIMGAGEANITAKQAGNDTYSAAADVTQKIIVNKRAITITADAKTKIYGDTDPGLTAQVTSGTIVTGDLATGSLTRAAGEAVADYAIDKGAYTYGSNYEETYFGANLSIGQLSINVRAVVDTKIYDGTNSSSVSPTYDALVNGDVVNTAPIQIFDNATVGTAHVLTASGLTINNGGADATGNYVINYIPTNATGVIQAKQVSVTDPTITVSKVYDSNITAYVIVGILSEVIPADVNNITITATASYSDASAGAAKIITVHYTLSGPASGSYVAPADYTLATAEITRKQLTISTPVVVTNKMLDGSSTAMITTIGTLQGVETGDVNDVTVTATANYDNSAVGSNKTITVVYALNGSAKDNYFAPANVVITGAKISDQITLNPLVTPVSGCENAELDLAYTILTGTPTQYKITFNSAAVAAGIQHVSYTNLPTDDTSGNLSITIPGGTPDGDYQGALQLKNELGIESPAYAFQFTINVSSDYIISKFDDVVLCDNSAHRFTGYQWYKNGVAIDGATKQFYNDLDGLVGSYSLRLTTVDGNTLFTCSKELNITLSQEVNVYPNPVKSSQTCFVEVLGFETIDLSGAELTVNTLQGIQIYHSNKVQKINSINLPDIPGMYVGHVTMVGGKKYVFKVNVE